MDRIRRRRGAWAVRCGIAAALIAAGGGAASAPGGAALADTADSPARRPHVLVLTGSDPYLPAFVAIDAAMRSAVAQQHGRSVVWAHESIDTMRFGGAVMPNVARLLQQKYEDARLDAIVLVSETAVVFHLRHGSASPHVSRFH